MKSFKSDQIDMIDKLLRKRLRDKGEPSASAQCSGFDPDLAAAYIEKALSPAEQQAYQKHLADCQKCRKLFSDLFFFVAESAAEASAQPVEAPRQPLFSFESLRAWIFGPQLRWVLPAALVFLLAGSVWIIMSRQSGSTIPIANKREAESPAVPPSNGRAPLSLNRQEEREAAPLGKEEASKVAAGKAPAEPLDALAKKAQPAESARLSGSGGAHAAMEKQKAGTLGAPQNAPQAAASGSNESGLAAGAAPNPTTVTADRIERESAISGTIVDSSGRSVAGAQVVLRDTNTGAQQYARADKEGNFAFSGLASGNYLIEAQTETQRKAQGVVVSDEENVRNLKLQFDAPAQIAINDNADLKEAPEKDKGGRAEMAKTERARPQEEAAEGRAASAPQPVAPQSVAISGGQRAKMGAKSVAPMADDESKSRRAPEKAEKRLDDDSGKKSESVKTRRVGNKTFLYSNGVWIDQQYLSKGEQKDLNVVNLEYKSEAYNQVLKEKPALKQYFGLGERVIVIYENTIYIATKRRL